MFPGMKECLLPSCWYSSGDDGEFLAAVEEAAVFISQPAAKEVGTPYQQVPTSTYLVDHREPRCTKRCQFCHIIFVKPKCRFLSNVS